MKKLIVILSLLVPITSYAAFSVPWQSDGIQSSISPILLNNVSQGILVNSATSTITNLVTVNATSTSATSTNLSVSGALSLPTGSVTNTFLQNSTISGISLGSNLADLTAGDTSLTFSGTYNGSAARNIVLNVGNANTWTAQQTLNAALLVNNATSTITNLTTVNATSTNATSTIYNVSTLAQIARLETTGGIYQGTVIAGGKGVQGMSITCDLFLGFGDCRFGTPNSNTSLNIDENGVMWFSGNSGVGTSPTGYYNVPANGYAFRSCGGTFAAPCTDTTLQYGLYFDQSGSVGGAGYSFNNAGGPSDVTFKSFITANGGGIWVRGAGLFGGTSANIVQQWGSAGTATTSWYAVGGKIGLATSSPTYKLSVGGDLGATHGHFASTTGTATSTFEHSILVGTTTPINTMLGIQGYQDFNFLSGYATTGETMFKVTKDGFVDSHGLSFSTAKVPTASPCGTGPSVAADSNDARGTVTTGTGATTCTLTFQESWTNRRCWVINNSAPVALTATTTATTVNINRNSIAFGAADVAYFCIQ